MNAPTPEQAMEATRAAVEALLQQLAQLPVPEGSNTAAAFAVEEDR